MGDEDAWLFTLEVVVEKLAGPAGRLLGDANALQPALALRVFDLPPVVLHASSGERYGAVVDSAVSFEGRGKVLSFTVPKAMLRASAGALRGSSEAERAPIPLWLMALGKQAEDAGPAAVLLATACVDLRGEIVRALSRAQGPCPKLACPFRRCQLLMKATRDASCSLSLNCYMRLYSGQLRQHVEGEMLLEPTTIVPELSGKPQRGSAAVPPESPAPRSSLRAVETQTEALDVAATRSGHASFADSVLEASASPSLASPWRHGRQLAAEDGRSSWPAAQAATGLPGSPALAGSTAPSRPARGWSVRVQEGTSGDVFFPGEIKLRGSSAAAQETGDGLAEGSLHSSATADFGGGPPPLTQRPSPGQSCGQAMLAAAETQEEPVVSTSLPLVSELLRELWQIRSVQ
eukprot:TRINITY_DN54379_c0_g1_i1.p1 TRINITY_DN54379_c0_g1~~TRINITY_DN54379_c0_g1_i1.p1  ORF type:complete len:405 (+),score=83.14 TRINITY_DN54379_c0_g1_i1:73-1287(+)